jgi:DNA-binding transcriptional MocR family regulator
MVEHLKSVEKSEAHIWEILGEHKGRLAKVETDIFQQQQANLNLRAELNGNFQRHEDRVEGWLHEVRTEILQPLLNRVGRMEKFMYMVVGGGMALWLLVINGAKIKEFIGL